MADFWIPRRAGAARDVPVGRWDLESRVTIERGRLRSWVCFVSFYSRSFEVVVG